MLMADPALRAQLQTEHHLMVHVHAERGDAAVLDTLLSCGFGATVKDRDGVTALHRAAMFGHAEAARVLLTHGARVDALEDMFSGTPLVWAAQGWSQGARADRDYLGVARQLIAAGSPIEWNAPEKAPDPERIHEQLAELCRAAATTAP
jgi:ankyrin repeat protein